MWMPSLGYPLLSDTAIYGVLGNTLLHHHAYSLFGVPHSKYLPLYPFLTIPFTSFFGFQIGLKLLSLLSGMCVLFLTHCLVERMSSRLIARITVLSLLVQHALPIMSGFGASDLSFTALVLLSILLFLERSSVSFLLSMTTLGLAIVLRYNAAPLLPIFCVSFLNNTKGFWHTKKNILLFFGGIFLALLPLSLWLLRTYLVFDTFFPADYVSEQSTRGGVTLLQILRNAQFYFHPLHTIGVFLPFAFFGVLRYGRQHLFLLFSMFSLWFFATFWWSLGVRHVFPGLPLLLFFSSLALRDFFFFLQSKRWVLWSLPVLVMPMVVAQGGMLCLYSFPQCNATLDRLNMSFLPKDLRLTQEGMYAWQKAAEWMNVHLPERSMIVMNDPSEAFVMQKGYFRSDLSALSADDFKHTCSSSGSLLRAYSIVQRSDDNPTTLVDASMDFLDLSPKTRVKILYCESVQ